MTPSWNQLSAEGYARDMEKLLTSEMVPAVSVAHHLIFPSARLASAEALDSGFLLSSFSAGIASEASAPMVPRTTAADVRTNLLLSLSASISAGTAGLPIFTRALRAG